MVALNIRNITLFVPKSLSSIIFWVVQFAEHLKPKKVEGKGYFLPTFMNTFFFILQNDQDKVAVDHIDSPYLGLKLVLSVLALFLLLIFLYLSFQLPINITVHPLLLRTHQGFSISLLLSLAASLLSPPALVWFSFSASFLPILAIPNSLIILQPFYCGSPALLTPFLLSSSPSPAAINTTNVFNSRPLHSLKHTHTQNYFGIYCSS